MEALSDFVERNWRWMRQVDIAVVAIGTVALLTRTRLGHAVRNPALEFSEKDFAKRRKFVVRFRGLHPMDDKLVINCHHEPAIAWWLGLRVWPFVRRSRIFPIRIYGVRLRKDGVLDSVFKDEEQLEVHTLCLGKDDRIVAGLVRRFVNKKDVGEELIEEHGERVRAFPDEEPGLFMSPNVKHIVKLDNYLTGLERKESKT